MDNPSDATVRLTDVWVTSLMRSENDWFIIKQSVPTRALDLPLFCSHLSAPNLLTPNSEVIRQLRPHLLFLIVLSAYM